MVIQKKTPNLLALLESHARGATPEVPVDPRPSTPILARSSPIKLGEKKERENARQRDLKIGGDPILSGARAFQGVQGH